MEIMATPREQTLNKTMRLRADLVEKLENLAKQQNRNFSNMVETLLLKQLDSKH